MKKYKFDATVSETLRNDDLRLSLSNFELAIHQDDGKGSHYCRTMFFDSDVEAVRIEASQGHGNTSYFKLTVDETRQIADYLNQWLAVHDALKLYK